MVNGEILKRLLHQQLSKSLSFGEGFRVRSSDKFHQALQKSTMLNTFFKISLRHIAKSKLYAAINVTGLAAGITCMLLAILYWQDEHSFDDFHSNNPNLYRIVTTALTKDGRAEPSGGTGQVQGPAFKAAVPEVKDYTRVMGGAIFSDVSAGNKSLHLQPLFVDQNFFDVFSFQLLHGNAKSVLSDISYVILTERTAMKFFNRTDVVGKLLTIDADPSFENLGKPLMVSGIVKDPPSNSSLQFDLLLTFQFMQLSFHDNNWLNAYLGTFVVLHPQANTLQVTRKFNDIYAVHAKEQLGKEEYDIYGFDPKITYNLQPVTDIHLNTGIISSGESGIVNTGNPLTSYLFMGIAVFILLMAVINFINISIAGSLKRMKEVGLRKIAGSSKIQIIVQFMCESALLCFIAFLLSVILLWIALPLFNTLAGKQFVAEKLINVVFQVYFLLLFAVIVLLTSLYPAYILSNFKAAEVLYNKQKLSGQHFFGKSLVVFQFSLAVFLLIASLIYHNQMDFVRTKDLGYNPSGIVRTSFSGDRDYKKAHDFLLNEFAKVPSIKAVSFGNDGWEEQVMAGSHAFKALYKNIDEHYLSTLEIPLLKGKNLAASSKAEINTGIIVNEAFVKAAGITDPVGKTITINLNAGFDSTQKYIRGVVKDFHTGSLRQKIPPMVMYLREVPDGGMWIRIDLHKQKEALAAIENIYRKVFPSGVYQFNFLNELNALQYAQEQRWQKIITVATIIAFVICCLGLFGLAHLSTARRTKEIGIRKVLGASVTQILTLLSADFLKLVMISFLVAIPLAVMVMNNWLQGFAYRTSLGPAVFFIAAIISVIAALIAIVFHTIKTAVANPVDSLRTE